MTFNKTLCAAAVLLAAHQSALAETRQHGTHEHGLAQLQVAVEGRQIQLQLASPMYNFAGFGMPKDEAQRERVAQIEQQLESGEGLFVFEGLKCKLLSASLQGGAFAASHDEEHGHHDEHAEDEHHDEHLNEHAKDEHHDDEHHDEHDKDEHHDEEHHDEHEHEDGEENHADVLGEWLYQCAAVAANPALDVRLFETFEHFDKLEVQLLSAHGQGADVLSAQHTKLPL